MDGRRFGVHHDIPRAGQHTREILAGAGYDAAQIAALIDKGVVGAG
jgi:crotonobetainyl-CoA:carnitine CoA-transferase CaiB-like acyl-CoA transferase